MNKNKEKSSELWTILSFYYTNEGATVVKELVFLAARQSVHLRIVLPIESSVYVNLVSKDFVL